MQLAPPPFWPENLFRPCNIITTTTTILPIAGASQLQAVKSIASSQVNCKQSNQLQAVKSIEGR
jgi:hypothetical protein